MRALILTLLFLANSAQALELYLWSPNRAIPPLVIPVRGDETPQQAAERYLTTAEQDPELADLFRRSPMPPMAIVAANFRKLDDHDFTVRALLLANRPEDYEQYGNWRIDSFKTPLEASGVHTYMLPFAGDLGLSEAESDEFVAALNLRFTSYVGMGGDDIDQRLFHFSIEGSKDVNGRRDRFEIKVVKKKVETIEAKHVTWTPSGVKTKRIDRVGGFCRFEQLLGLLTGFQVAPNIDGHGGHSERPVEGNAGAEELAIASAPVVPMHPLKLLPTPKSIFEQMARDHHGEIETNTYHHQCLLSTPKSRLLTAAVNPEDGCIEGVESEDGNIFGVQGHPELMAQRNEGLEKRYGLNFMRRFAEWLTPMREDCEQAMRSAAP